jgi:hypothetical protein
MKLEKVSGKLGAPMGRTKPHHLQDDGLRVHLCRVRLDNGGYDQGGAYWGLGQLLYHAYTDTETGTFFRARSRDAAKAIVRETIPSAKFYR